MSILTTAPVLSVVSALRTENEQLRQRLTAVEGAAADALGELEDLQVGAVLLDGLLCLIPLQIIRGMREGKFCVLPCTGPIYFVYASLRICCEEFEQKK